MLKKKLPKKERKHLEHRKTYLGLCLVLFALLWMYFDAKIALLIIGLLIFLKGLLMKSCC